MSTKQEESRSGKINLLLVEDNPDDLLFFKEMLGEAQDMLVNCQHAMSLADAFLSLETLEIDIIFMDLGLPDSSGLEGLSAVQSRFPDKAVVILTGGSDVLTGVKAVRAGAQDYLLKDQLDGGLLSRVIRYSIERKKVEIELQQAKNQVQASESRFRRLIEKNADAMVIVDDEGLIRFANPAAELLWGLNAAELAGCSFGFPLANNRLTEIEIRKRKGHLAIAEMLVAELEWEGKPAHLVSLRDITQKKELEDESRKVEKLGALARLSGGIAHDFNNALTAIWGNIQMAKAALEPQSPTFRSLIRAENSCAKAEALSNLLFSFSKQEKPIKKKISLRELFRNPHWITLESLYIELEVDISPNSWEIEVEVDYLKEAFNYFFINAKEAMPGGGKIKIKAENLRVAENQFSFSKKGKYVKITIADQGIGIPGKNILNIFDPYFTTKPGRIGLGLSIAYSIIQRHEGSITVQSELTKGTTFNIYLPAQHKKVGTGKSLSKPGIGTTPVKGKPILIMEDDMDTRGIAREMFTHLGCEVSFAGNGDEAVKIYKDRKKAGTPFALVVIDLKDLDETAGILAIKELLKFDPDVKAAASISIFKNSLIADYSRRGFSGAFSKPYTLQKLEQLLKKTKIAG